MKFDTPCDGELIVTEHGIYRAPVYIYVKHGYPPYQEPTPVERMLFEKIERLEKFMDMQMKLHHPLNVVRKAWEES